MVTGRVGTGFMRIVIDGGSDLLTRYRISSMVCEGVLQGAPLRFERARDVPHGGVLLALPALLVEGLLRHARKLFRLPEGFYPLETIFLVLAFTALARLRSLEALRYEPPGEWPRSFRPLGAREEC
jgi:hypothetical protein